MPRKNGLTSADRIIASLGEGALSIEIRKSRIGAVLVISGALGIDEYSDERIVVLSHSGRITLLGEGLNMSTLANRAIEIYGKIEGVGIGYGKS